jgi:hypothetical protein
MKSDDLLRCHEVPTMKPIVKCPGGHWLCRGCSSSFSCAGCYNFAKQRPERSLLAETILAVIPKKCRNWKNGCAAVIKELGNHESEDCSFARVDCVLDCGVQVLARHFLDHLLTHDPCHEWLLPGLDAVFGVERWRASGRFLLDTSSAHSFDAHDPDQGSILQSSHFGRKCSNFVKFSLIFLTKTADKCGSDNFGLNSHVFCHRKDTNANIY